jgi:demethylmenaquinone methyltransferase/2-methoxy-6-polyprenyl-1,4-benzoquinol methylase
MKSSATNLVVAHRWPKLTQCSLPFADCLRRCRVAVAFGLRNLANVQAGIERDVPRAETWRAGRASWNARVRCCLAFAKPTSFYFHHILPRIGALLSGSRARTPYLPKSVSNFPDQKRLAALMLRGWFCERAVS